jgi:hypothetical protein
MAKETFKFMVDNRPYETEQQVITGAQIKATAGVDPSFGLNLQGHGQDPDRKIADGDSVDLSEPGREHFYSVPPATYGHGC